MRFSLPNIVGNDKTCTLREETPSLHLVYPKNVIAQL